MICSRRPADWWRPAAGRSGGGSRRQEEEGGGRAGPLRMGAGGGAAGAVPLPRREAEPGAAAFPRWSRRGRAGRGLRRPLGSCSPRRALGWRPRAGRVRSALPPPAPAACKRPVAGLPAGVPTAACPSGGCRRAGRHHAAQQRGPGDIFNFTAGVLPRQSRFLLFTERLYRDWE